MINHLKKIVESLIRNISGSIGRRIRFFYYNRQFKTCGKNIVIDEGVFFENLKNISLGSNIWFDKNTILIGGAFNSKNRNYHVKGEKKIPWGELLISDGVHIAPFSLIQAHGGVRIGENVTVASGAKIYSLSHHYRNLNTPEDEKRYSFSSMAKSEDQFLIVGNVIIGKNAAIGLNSVVLPGTEIPNGTWLGVLSLISGEKVKPNTILSSIK
ncbi:hypothetical protein BTO04_06435 [Polaribacter sp. SA4-10]|uniref:acyltransferase n=1 Tax=Polaribacter sp. SA4-10 TaxID=754397 RepID=UPI000B3D308F|nr:hypothetical protein [Polaribacter sp. SA4-10]ARV06360.1 hypothetical protein BTO04_06435 [Polaribacter sp. SA4-10]